MQQHLRMQVIGSGSEMVLDVAPGVDWTLICGIMMCVQQVQGPCPLSIIMMTTS